MSIYTTAQNPTLEQAILEIINSLPYERVAQLLDFARFLQTQSIPQKLPYEDITEAELLLEEEAWQQTLVAKQDYFRALASQARADREAGRTHELILENGKLAIR